MDEEDYLIRKMERISAIQTAFDEIDIFGDIQPDTIQELIRLDISVNMVRNAWDGEE